MIRLGLIDEGKVPVDKRVALAPAQVQWLHANKKDLEIVVQSSNHRCFSDKEYLAAGVKVVENMDDCDILLGIKEVPVSRLIPNKTYLFFSHTKKLQPHNRKLLQEIVAKKITLIDFECLEHDDGTRIIGFGFFAGVVGAHNAMVAYGNRTGAYQLNRVNPAKSFQNLIHTYFGLKVPNIKIAVTGSGRVAHGILEIMNLLGIHEVEPDEYLSTEFDYPAYVHLKGADLYQPENGGQYIRQDFHTNPENYVCLFKDYLAHTDILLNGIYWAPGIPRLFENADVKSNDFRIRTIGDITDDQYGSVPINITDGTIENFVYGIDRMTLEKTLPYLPGSVDIMAVGNLPNELPKDASRYFGEQLIKYVIDDLLYGNEKVIKDATIVKNGVLTEKYQYMYDYAYGS